MWIDIDDGSESQPDHRSRLVAQEIKTDKRQELFAATPPLEALMMIPSGAATETHSRERRKVIFIDAKKAHLNPLCEDEVFIEPPVEAGAGDGFCGQLLHWLYGCRPAPSPRLRKKKAAAPRGTSPLLQLPNINSNSRSKNISLAPPNLQISP